MAYADQAAAAASGAIVRLRRLVPQGRMYLLREEKAKAVSFGFELEQLAERVISINTATPP